MKTMTRLLLIAFLVLPFTACKKAEAPQVVVKAPMAAPATNAAEEDPSPRARGMGLSTSKRTVGALAPKAA